MSATTTPDQAAFVDPRTLVEREAEVVAAIWPPAGHPRLVCQEPGWEGKRTFGRVVRIHGWAIGATGTPEVEVELGPLRTRAAIGFLRPDVAGDFHERGAAESGWSVSLPLQSVPRGVHQLVVTAHDPSETSTSVTRYLRIDPDFAYRAWLERRQAVPIDEPGWLSTLPVWIDEGGSEDLGATLASLDRQEGALAERVEGLSLDELTRALAQDKWPYVVVTGVGQVLAPHALRSIAARLVGPGPPDLVYADDDTLGPDDTRYAPRFKPQWSPELLLGRDYIGEFFAISARAARTALEVDGATVTGTYDLLLRLVDTDLWVERIADVLVSRPWRDQRQAATNEESDLVRAVARRRGAEIDLREVAPGLRDVGWHPTGQPRVSLIILTGPRPDLLARCVETIRARTTYPNVEVVIVDNGEHDLAPLLGPLGDIDHPLVSAPGPFNYSRLNNLGAQAASGDFLLFLNDDIEIETDGWIESLVAQCEQPGVGMVGVKMVFPSGLINHAGVFLSREGPPARLLYGSFPADDPGYDGDLLVARNCSAVGTACAIVSKALFESLAGFDEGIAVELGDVDLCLRAQAAGRRVVWTPRVSVVHHERASRGAAVSVSDWARFSTRWERTLQAGDPYWNPHLSEEPQGDVRSEPPSLDELTLMASRVASDGPPTRLVALPVPEQKGEARPSAERFVPATMGGSTIQAEHEARYRWAATSVSEKDVLDAGCGVGYGTRICVEGGARRAVGVDASEHAVADAAALARGSSAEYIVGDLRELPLADDSFDVAVCFEAIEHVAETDSVLDQLRRVLRKDGVLLISSPNRGVYPGGNPHHLHELTPDELEEALARRFENVALYRQSSWITTLITDDAGQRSASSEESIDASLHKVVGREPGAELYTVAAASDASLPRLPGIAVMAEPGELESVYSRLEHGEKLVEAAEHTAKRSDAAAAALLRELEEQRELMEQVVSDMKSSVSWRVTAPIRALKRSSKAIRTRCQRRGPWTR